jgi:lipopolysaccharide export LptBFGC system permease protein LptF
VPPVPSQARPAKLLTGPVHWPGSSMDGRADLQFSGEQPGKSFTPLNAARGARAAHPVAALGLPIFALCFCFYFFRFSFFRFFFSVFFLFYFLVFKLDNCLELKKFNFFENVHM